MRVEEAARFARGFACGEAARYPGFCGAYLAGSILALRDGDALPAGSDVDVVLVFEDPGVYPHSKQCRGGCLLEASPLPAAAFAGAETVLTTHYLAWAMAHGRILLDPTGMLGLRHREAAALWQSGRYLRLRRDGFLKQLSESGAWPAGDVPLQDRVTPWVFGAGIATFPILTAAGENCTVRRRFSAVRAVLNAYGAPEFCARLTALLTGDEWDAAGMARHMEALEAVFRRACASSGPSAHWRFRCEIQPALFDTAVGATRRILESDFPQDAVFWMLATFARCMTVLWMDDTAAWGAFLPDLRALLAALGIHGDADFAARRAQLQALLPEIHAVTEQILKVRGK